MSFLIKIPQILVPQVAKLKEGEMVDWLNKSLTDRTEEETVVNVATELNIQTKDIFKHLKVTLAQKIKENDILAEKKTLFSSHTLKFPKEAEVRSINHHEGTITLVIEKKTDVPFSFKGKFVKAEKGEATFKVSAGKALEVVCPLPNSFAGECVYLEKEEEIEPEKIQKKIVVTTLNNRISLSKIAAFDEAAIVVYKTSYYHKDAIILPVQNQALFSEIIQEKWPFCLYYENSKIIYFYRS